MPYMRHRLTILTLSVVAVLTAVLAGGGPASAQEVDGRVCTDGSANLEAGGIQLGTGPGAQDDCVRFSVG